MERRHPAVLYLVAVAGAVLLSCLVTIGFSYYFHGLLRLDYLVTGFLTSLVVSVLISYLFVALLTRLHNLKARIEELAATDDLTGVLNRRMYEITVRQEMARCRRYTQPLSMIMVDIDHFKNINDTLGHSRGDLVLRGIADAISDNLRASDYLFRYGGEEFVVLSPQTDIDGVHILANRIKTNVQKLRLPGVPPLTISLGLVSSNHEMSCQDMLEKADEALYAAKTKGRNRIELAM